MRITQLISAVSPRFGGPSIGALALNDALRDLGHSAVLITGDYAEHDGRSMLPTEIARVTTGRRDLFLLPASRPYRLKRARRMLRTTVKAVKSSDFVHLHGQYEFAQIATLLALLRYPRPLSVQPHGTFEPYQLAHSALKKRIYHSLVGRALLKRARVVVFASGSEAQRAELVDPDKRLVIPLGVELQEPTIDAPLQEMLTVGRDNGPRVLFLGRLAAKKRPEMLLHAWAAAKRPTGGLLVMAGPDDDWTSDQLKEMAQRLGVGDSVCFAGEVQGGAKTWLYQQCSIFALPSDNENFAISVAEAMAAGCYCIVTDQVAASIHVSRAEAGRIIPAGDQASLTTALEAALQRDANDSAESSRRARDYAATHLSWRKFAQSLIDAMSSN